MKRAPLLFVVSFLPLCLASAAERGLRSPSWLASLTNTTAAASQVTYVSCVATNSSTVSNVDSLLTVNSGSGANRLLLVIEAVNYNGAPGNQSTNITWNGEVLTKFGDADDEEYALSISCWYLLNPTADTTSQVTIHYTGVPDYSAVTAFIFYIL